MAALVVFAAVWLLLSPAGGAHPRARAAACGFSYVDATVYNDTNFRMDPYFFDKGLTNSVCDDQHPGSVQPHSSGHWKVGDVLFGTSVKIRYRLTNGDEVELNVFVYPGERNPTLSCGWTQVVSSPRAFDCRASWVSGGVTGKAKIQLQIFPVGGCVRNEGTGVPVCYSVRHAAQSRSAAARKCLHRSALIGTTTNQTGVPLTLVSVSHGKADAWCRAPRRSQAAHSAGHWKLGGPRSGASARFVYRLPNGDDVEFATAIDPRGGAIGCAPIDRARARLFGCRAVEGAPRAKKDAQQGAPAPGTSSEAPRINLAVFPIRTAK